MECRVGRSRYAAETRPVVTRINLHLHSSISEEVIVQPFARKRHHDHRNARRHTSRPGRAHPEHKVYPYLLRGVAVVRPNQVWSTDITCIRLAQGFAYLVAVLDWYSRRVLSWRISNSMETAFCVDCLEEALRTHGKPEIFNSDQGTQFTSHAFTGVLKREEIVISMDGRGRVFDNIFVERLWRNVKYEDVSLLSKTEIALGRPGE